MVDWCSVVDDEADCSGEEGAKPAFSLPLQTSVMGDGYQDCDSEFEGCRLHALGV